MKRVYKYPLGPTKRQTIFMPALIDVLCVQIQYDVPTIWALVETSNEPTPVEFYVASTGEDLSEILAPGCRYIGTFQLHSGTAVYHLYQL